MVVLVSVRRRSALKGENLCGSAEIHVLFVYTKISAALKPISIYLKFSPFKTLNGVRIRHPLLSAL